MKEKVKEFAVKTNQGAICWYCPVKKAAGYYEVPQTDLSDVYGGLTQYFVRGAQCVLTKSLETKLGLGKESAGIMLDAIWNDENKAVDIDNLDPGTVTKVSQPDYLIIKIFIDKDQHEIICTRPKRREFEDKQQKRVYRSYKGHQVDLAAAITYHKMQGKTLESIILSLNSIRGVSNKLCGLTLPSLYVGCSRVHDQEHLRVLPFSDAVRKYLKKLKWDSKLTLFFRNFDTEGRWIKNGLDKYRKQRVKDTLLELGMIDLSELTVKEATDFANELDKTVKSEKDTPIREDYTEEGSRPKKT